VGAYDKICYYVTLTSVSQTGNNSQQIIVREASIHTVTYLLTDWLWFLFNWPTFPKITPG